MSRRRWHADDHGAAGSGHQAGQERAAGGHGAAADPSSVRASAASTGVSAAAGPALPDFPPTLAAARARLAAVDPVAYGRSRNALDGAVSALSPYVTHGFLSLPDVHAGVRPALKPTDKFTFELGWRAFFRHVWAHEGDRIFDSLHAGPLPDDAYARELPADLREARTGVPVIDACVRDLYGTGWLHNHARLWLAAYVVHWRRVHWRTGADWLYGHLLDGDLASNHLSWQWVAGTGSHQPYLFNAQNVAKYAGRRLEEFDSRGTVVDIDYDTARAIAEGAPLPRGGQGRRGPLSTGVEAPALSPTPPAGLLDDLRDAAPDDVAGQRVWVAHPWCLRDPPAGTIAVIDWPMDFHTRWPWSERRWRFVGTRLREISRRRWHPSLVPHAASVEGLDDPHRPRETGPALPPGPALFTEPDRRCRSFSAYWSRVRTLNADEDVAGQLGGEREGDATR